MAIHVIQSQRIEVLVNEMLKTIRQSGTIRPLNAWKCHARRAWQELPDVPENHRRLHQLRRLRARVPE